MSIFQSVGGRIGSFSADSESEFKDATSLLVSIAETADREVTARKNNITSDDAERIRVCVKMFINFM